MSVPPYDVLRSSVSLRIYDGPLFGVFFSVILFIIDICIIELLQVVRDDIFSLLWRPVFLCIAGLKPFPLCHCASRALDNHPS